MHVMAFLADERVPGIKMGRCMRVGRDLDRQLGQFGLIAVAFDTYRAGYSLGGRAFLVAAGAVYALCFVFLGQERPLVFPGCGKPGNY